MRDGGLAVFPAGLFCADFTMSPLYTKVVTARLKALDLISCRHS
jgi:hypothetical protein